MYRILTDSKAQNKHQTVIFLFVFLLHCNCSDEPEGYDVIKNLLFTQLYASIYNKEFSGIKYLRRKRSVPLGQRRKAFELLHIPE